LSEGRLWCERRPLASDKVIGSVGLARNAPLIRDGAARLVGLLAKFRLAAEEIRKQYFMGSYIAGIGTLYRKNRCTIGNTSGFTSIVQKGKFSAAADI
jgi:hypothetical protein